MANLSNVIVGRTLDGNGASALLNFSQLTLTQPASGNNDAVRFTEYNTAVTNLQNQITTIANDPSFKSSVYVDTVSPDLITAVSNATYNNDGTFTFGTTVIGAGDIVILNNADEQDSDRAWVHNGGTAGNVDDFSAFGSDVDAAIQAVKTEILGSAATYTDLGLVETELDSLGLRVSTVENNIVNHAASEVLTFPANAWVDNGDGTFTITIGHTFNSSAIGFQIQEDNGDGTWQYVSDGLSVDVSVSDTQFVIVTGSASVASKGYRLVCSGLKVQ